MNPNTEAFNLLIKRRNQLSSGQIPQAPQAPLPPQPPNAQAPRPSQSRFPNRNNPQNNVLNQPQVNYNMPMNYSAPTTPSQPMLPNQMLNMAQQQQAYSAYSYYPYNNMAQYPNQYPNQNQFNPAYQYQNQYLQSFQQPMSQTLPQYPQLPQATPQTLQTTQHQPQLAANHMQYLQNQYNMYNASLIQQQQALAMNQMPSYSLPTNSQPQPTPLPTQISKPYHPPSDNRKEKPPPELFYCEACEKEFTSQSAYKAHNDTHETCHYPGCTFVASKKVVSAHYHSVHGLYSGSGFKNIEVEGQSFRVLLGTTPEEVAKWREERKSKFPTSQRVQQRNEKIKEMIDNGAILNKDQEQIAKTFDESNNELSKNSNNLESNRKNKGKQNKQNNQNNKRKNNQDTDSNTKQKQTQNNKNNDNNNPNKLRKLTYLSDGSNGSLYRKLLEKEVTCDDNLILQAIQFICDNNFFDPDYKPLDLHSDQLPTKKQKLIEEISITENNGQESEVDSYAIDQSHDTITFIPVNQEPDELVRDTLPETNQDTNQEMNTEANQSTESSNQPNEEPSSSLEANIIN